MTDIQSADVWAYRFVTVKRRAIVGKQYTVDLTTSLVGYIGYI